MVISYYRRQWQRPALKKMNQARALRKMEGNDDSEYRYEAYSSFQNINHQQDIQFQKNQHQLLPWLPSCLLVLDNHQSSIQFGTKGPLSQIGLCLFILYLIFNDNYMNQEQLQPFQQFYDELGYSQAQLRWSHNPHSLLLTGASDFAVLSKLKNVILSLRKDWGAEFSKGIHTEGDRDIEKRLLLAESEVEGLLKRKINYSVKDSNGERVLDYSTLLNEKENQVVELEKKIQNIEDKLRRAADRQQQLEEHVVRLTQELKRKEDLIALKHNSAVAEVTISTAFRDAFNRIKRNVDLNKFKIGENEKLIFEGVTFPDVGNFDIKSDVFSEGTLSSRSRVFQQQTDGLRYKTRLVQFFREFERLVSQSQGITDFEVERILQGFLLNMTDSKLYQKVQHSIEQYRSNQELKRLKENFAVAAGIFVQLITQIKRDNVAYTLPAGADNIFELLKQEKVVAAQVASGAVFISHTTGSRTIEVPVQDARTKHLIHLLAHELKGLFLRYPKIQCEIDPKLAEFLQQEIIDVIEADEMEKLIQIVKFVPQIVKVENVYTQSTAKERKVEFHLRILIKALLQELQKVRAKNGIVLQLDQGILGMVRAEIMDAVNVEDILKVFRVCPKIVEVQKIVEKVVQRLVEVPKVITVEKIVEKIVQVEKIKEVERIVHVPVEKPLIVQTQVERLVPVQNKVETIVEVPTIVQKMVQLQKEVTKVMEVQVIKQKIVEVEKPVEVERVVNHIQTEYQEVQVVVEKLVPVEKVVEKIIEVPVFVEKIVQRVVEVAKLVEVERVVEKIVPVIEYRNAREVQNHIEVKYQVVDRIVEKLVPVVQWRERIKQVPQVVQVIKQATNVVTEIKEVEVIREKIVVQEVIKEVPVVETQLVEVIREVIKEVDRFIEVPVIREVAVIKELIVEKPVISRVESVHIQEVVLKEPLIIKEPTIVEVQKFVNIYVDVPKPIKYIQEKIVEVPTTVDRIKEVRVVVEKIIEKMVEVPRVVEVQKIVEKVVIVPRVIQKVVEVPQFVQKIVEKEVIREVIREIERIVHVPVIQETIKEVQVIKNVYIEIEKPVDRVIERAVEVPRIQEKVITREVLRQVPINLIHEVPRDLEVQKVIPQVLETLKVVQVDRQIIVPYEIPVPVDRIVEKIVPREEIIERVIPVPQVIEKLVPVVQEMVQLQEVQRIVERILIEKSIVEVERLVPYYQEVIKEIPTIVQRLIPVQSKVEQIVTAQQIIEKVIERTITIPQIHQVERVREKLVEVPKLIEVERIIPQIIRVNQYIQKIVEKMIEVPTIIETMKEVVREQERIVPISSQTTEIVEVERRVQKLVYAEKLKEVVRNVNYIEKVLQIIDRIEQVPVAVTTVQERLIEVPVILEKIVQRIVVMPQIVEVLKYVTEVCEVGDAGVKVQAEVGAHEARFKELSRSIEQHLDAVLKELRYLKSDQVTRARIETIEKFLDELRRFILTPRIVKVIEEKIIEKEVPVDHIVRMPVQDDKSLRMELSLGILAEKLVAEVKRLKAKTGANIELDQDIRLIFFADLNSPVNLQGEMQAKLKSYSSLIQRQFESLGSWTLDHQLMLNSFLQERFLMAELIQNANFEIQQAKAVSDQRMEGLKRYRGDANAYAGLLAQIGAIIADNRPVVEIVGVVQEFERLKASGRPETQHTFPALDLTIDSERIESLLRQKDAEIVMLRDSLFQSRQRSTEQPVAQQEGIIKVLKGEIDNLRKENTALLGKSSEVGLVQSYRQQIADLQNRNLHLQQEISRLTSDNYNQANELKLMLHNVSFKREPEATFQEVDIREERSRLQQSQSSQGRSLTGSQAQGRAAEIGGFTSSVYVAPKGGLDTKLQTEQKAGESKLSQSGVKNVQTPPVSSFENVSLVKSGIYTTQAGQYGAGYEPYLSQKKEGQQGQQGQQGISSSRVEPISQFGQSLYQSGVQKYQPDIKNFGVEESGAAGQGVSGQSGVRQTQTSGVYQAQSTIYQAGTTPYQPQSSLYQSSQGTTYQPLQGGANQGQSGLYQSVTSTIRPGQQQQSSVISQGGQEGGSSRLAGSQSSQLGAVRPGETLYSSRQDVSRGVTPATQTLYYDQGQQGRSAVGGATGTLYGSQAQGTTTSAQSSIIHTPIESLKYRSPSPKGGKLTESILKQEESLSKLSAQSPQVFKKQEGGRGEYKYYYRPEKKD